MDFADVTAIEHLTTLHVPADTARTEQAQLPELFVHSLKEREMGRQKRQQSSGIPKC